MCRLLFTLYYVYFSYATNRNTNLQYCLEMASIKIYLFITVRILSQYYKKDKLFVSFYIFLFLVYFGYNLS